MATQNTQNGVSEMIAARVPLPLVERLEAAVADVDMSRSKFIVKAIAAAVDRHEKEKVRGAVKQHSIVL